MGGAPLHRECGEVAGPRERKLAEQKRQRVDNAIKFVTAVDDIKVPEK